MSAPPDWAARGKFQNARRIAFEVAYGGIELGQGDLHLEELAYGRATGFSTGGAKLRGGGLCPGVLGRPFPPLPAKEARNPKALEPGWPFRIRHCGLFSSAAVAIRRHISIILMRAFAF